MPDYRRAYIPGGSFFFTVVTQTRRPILCSPHARSCLRDSITSTRAQWPFEVEAFVLLPDHLHCIWTLPHGDSDFSIRWANIKRRFSKQWRELDRPQAELSRSQRKHREAGIWQRRFWEHVIRDQDDFNQHVDYIHFNPVKHGLVARPIDRPYSSLHRFVATGLCDSNWGSAAHGEPDFDRLNTDDVE